MTLFVKTPITTPMDTSIAFGGNGIIGILNLKVVQNLTGSVGFVGKDVLFEILTWDKTSTASVASLTFSDESYK